MITINDRDFYLLVKFVRSGFGINLEHKRQLINARLAFEIKKQGYSDFASYVSHIIDNPQCEECQNMINRLSTNYTYFFREPDYIERLCSTVIGDFISKGITSIRIWCAACSSGQEPYSTAMALEAYKELYKLHFNYKIIGTDINTIMLETAKSGVYNIDELTNIPEKYRHFTSHHTCKTFEISEEIRSKISWKYKNLIDNDCFSDTYNIILCRNVMIYFTPSLRREMIEKLYSSLSDNGYLFTGATESVDLERKYFEYIAPSFYRKQ